MTTTIKKITGAETKLEKHVQAWLNNQASGYENGVKGVLIDLLQGGCQNGTVGHLIYHRDTLSFYKRYKADINTILKQAIEDSGAMGMNGIFGDKWDIGDQLAIETNNQNLLAWFGFEEAARNLANKNGIEI